MSDVFEWHRQMVKRDLNFACEALKKIAMSFMDMDSRDMKVVGNRLVLIEDYGGDEPYAFIDTIVEHDVLKYRVCIEGIYSICVDWESAVRKYVGLHVENILNEAL